MSKHRQSEAPKRYKGVHRPGRHEADRQETERRQDDYSEGDPGRRERIEKTGGDWFTER